MFEPGSLFGRAPKEKVTILYKSGQRVHVRCKSFKVTRFASGSLEVSWDTLRPPALLLGIDDIEAVWNGWV